MGGIQEGINYLTYERDRSKVKMNVRFWPIDEVAGCSGGVESCTRNAGKGILPLATPLFNTTCNLYFRK